MSACRVRGRLSRKSPRRSSRCGRHARSRTYLRGGVTDQAALHGLLARFDALGVEIVEFIRLPIT